MFKDLSTFGKLMMTVLIVLAGTFLFSILSFGIVFTVYDVSFSDLMNSLQNNINALKIMQIFQSIGMFIVPAIVLSKMFYGNFVFSLHLNQKISAKQVFLALSLILVALPFISFLAEINTQLKLPESLAGLEEMMRNSEKKATELTESFLRVKSFSALLINVLMIAVLPAIGEELFFRGLILKIFNQTFKNNIHLSVWITALLFSFFHFQFYGFLPRAILGAFLGYLFVWSGSIWLPILAHFLNNFLATIGYFLMERGVMSNNFDSLEINTKSTIIALISAIITIFILILLKKDAFRETKKEYYN